MQTQKFPLSPPSLDELAEKLQAPLAANYEHSTVSVVLCPDLRESPFHLATEGLSGDEKVADVGGQPNLFPRPRLDAIWSMTDIAKTMEMNPEKGGLIGAGAGPFHVVGQNCELAPNLGWQGGRVDNRTRHAQIDRDSGTVSIQKSSSLDCALMINLYGSTGNPGPVIKITGRKRKGPEKSFTECIRKGLYNAYGDSQTISLGGVFVIKSGRTHYHIMPDFPSKGRPFKDPQQLNSWLTYHDFDGLADPIVCFSVLHSADPGKAMGLRMEHTHGYSASGGNAGGHYHYDLDDTNEEIEYEAYFNSAKAIYRLDKPAVTLERDLHD
ncbi:hypothetical protein FDECE_13115 [Fusarium decemcellulare]|nr:hypothetical protein FDECE_13115 [Fusarium decemcellulare]